MRNYGHGCFLVFFLIGLLLAGTRIGRAADRFVVTTNAAASYPYVTWPTAATNIQDAINAAQFGGETIWVSNGTYRLTNAITITNNIAVRSVNGYSNTFVYAAWPSYATRCFSVANTGIVDGFTISNGFLAGSNNYSGGGGAVISNNGVIQNCYFINNICSNAGVYAGGGGAFIYNYGLISNCWFVTNMAYLAGDSNTNGLGGGVSLYGGSGAYVVACTIISNFSSGLFGGGVAAAAAGASGSNLNNIVSNCFIAANLNTNQGGGLFIEKGKVIDCVISNNRALRGGGLGIRDGYADNCAIINNLAETGGGVYAATNGALTNCVIAGNQSTNAPGGGGIFLEAGGWASRCYITNNLSSYGGGGGVSMTNACGVRSSLICNNTNTAAAAMGGGGALLGNTGRNPSNGLVNCTVVNNYSGNDGGGIATLGTSNNIVNCIIVSNRSLAGVYPNIQNEGGNSNNYWYCNANVTNTPLAPNQGNITNAPRFVDSRGGNWRLLGASPGVNAGTNQGWMADAFDLDGSPRRRFGTVDMGAYEAVPRASIYHISR